MVLRVFKYSRKIRIFSGSPYCRRASRRVDFDLIWHRLGTRLRRLLVFTGGAGSWWWWHVQALMLVAGCAAPATRDSE